jgi:hypothetical protein
MKTIPGIMIGITVALGSLSPAAHAQAPSSIAGDGILTKITSGTYPLASYGWAILLPASTGNAYQMIGIYNTGNNSGTYSYTNMAPDTGRLILNDTTDRITDQVAFHFSGATEGTFDVVTLSPPGYHQSGSFLGVTGTAPGSLAGKTIICTIEAGQYPLSSTGTFTLTTAASGYTYTISGNGGVRNSSGTYSYAIINRSTAIMQISDSIAGTSALYIGFSDPSTGRYCTTQLPRISGYQIGAFVVLDTTPPTVTVTAPAAGQRWSNSLFSITGKASDDVLVTAVYYQLGDQGWELAPTANHWTNWSADVLLKPGTNICRAYGVDATGNWSTTNTVRFQYVVPHQPQIGVTGLGTLSPNYSNAWLEIGRNYRITATPGNGFVFTNWTGSIATNGATVTFMMVSNLTLAANFVDVSKPTLTITNLVAGQRVSDGGFIVKGAAADNWQINSVMCQLNGDVWTNAAGTNNWSLPVNLVPGTNRLAAYATDSIGNRSSTNTWSFQFVVTNQLGVRASGLGTISPNYSNAWLEIGRNYSITAKHATGFMVTNWTISTNWIAGVKTNKATVQFMMASNLTLQVNFADTNRPTLTISSPTAGRRMTNALANLIGTASDNWKVTGVWYQLNGSPWDLVCSTNNFTNWTKTVTLLAGTNTLKAYAQDLGGNFSLTNSLSVFSTNAFRLQLTFSNAPVKPDGLVFNLQMSPGLNGRILVSTNLIDWSAFANFAGTNSTLTFRDPAVTNHNHRFYRAVIP